MCEKLHVLLLLRVLLYTCVKMEEIGAVTEGLSSKFKRILIYHSVLENQDMFTNWRFTEVTTTSVLTVGDWEKKNYCSTAKFCARQQQASRRRSPSPRYILPIIEHTAIRHAAASDWLEGFAYRPITGCSSTTAVGLPHYGTKCLNPENNSVGRSVCTPIRWISGK